MLRWTTALYILGLVAALLGFGGLTVVTAGLARLLIVLFLAAFVVSLAALAIGVLRYDAGASESDHSSLGGAMSAGAPSTSE
jgi:uncharacterized membrane protein YtjA (UPF0391 family)